MVGLVNAITMNVLERTREIGVLRCIGARARDIRRIFAVEGLTVSLLGWLLGIPVGYALARVLNWLLLEVVKIEFAFTFPPLNVLIALVGTVVLALLLMRIHSGVRFAPSRGRPSAMHEPAIGLPRVLRGARLPLTRHVESAGLDVLLFSGATAIVAVHAIVDSFVAPEPGTGPEDHLLRGSVSLAILALAAVAYPRLRDGARAALAAALGRSRSKARRSRSRTPVRSAPGERTGPTSCSSRSAWCSSRWPSCCCGARGSPAGSAPPPWRDRHRDRRCGIRPRLAARDRDPRDPPSPCGGRSGRARTAVRGGTVRTAEGLDLAAWYVPSRNGAAVLSYPTRRGLPQARMLVRHGYGVLLLDARGYDGSEGDPNLLGWEGAKDIDAAVAWLRRRPDVTEERIGGIGFSVGGETMLEAAASNTGLRAVVSEGAGTRSVREDVLRGPRGWLALPQSALQTAAVAVASGTAPHPRSTTWCGASRHGQRS